MPDVNVIGGGGPDIEERAKQEREREQQRCRRRICGFESCGARRVDGASPNANDRSDRARGRLRRAHD
jgi:hypothetical protein